MSLRTLDAMSLVMQPVAGKLHISSTAFCGQAEGEAKRNVPRTCELECLYKISLCGCVSCGVRLERAGNDDLDDGVAIFADALRVGFERLLRLLESVAIPPTTETIYQSRLCLRC